MKCCNSSRGMDIAMNDPAVVSGVITLPFDKVFQPPPAHVAVEYHFNYEFLFAINKFWLGWGGVPTTGNRVRRSRGQFDDGEDIMEASKRWRECKTICAVSNACFDGVGTQSTMRKLC